VALQKEKALNGENPARLLFERQQDSLEDAWNAELVVFLGGVQPIRIPVTGFAEHQHTLRFGRNPQLGAKCSFPRMRDCCAFGAQR